MFHEREINYKMNKIYERALRIVYNDTFMSFEELLVKDKTFTIDHQNIKSLEIEMYKAVNNLLAGNLSRFFLRSNHNYNLPSKSELTVPSINTVFIGQNYSISCFGFVIWNSIPAELRGKKIFSSFQIRNKSIATKNCPFRLCKNYIENLVFVSVASSLVRHIWIFNLLVDFNHFVD